jgi:hypothetical protein
LGRTQQSEDSGVFSTLATPVLIIDLVAVFLFYLGWTYIYFLYYHFGINVHALNIPIYYFFVYAHPVIAENELSFFVAGIILLIVLLFINNNTRLLGTRCRWLSDRAPLIRKGVLIIFALALFPLSFQLARTTADRNAAEMRSGNAKTVYFTFKPETISSYPEEVRQANETGALKLLLQTKDRFIVFYQPVTEEAQLPIASTYVVFNADIRLATIKMSNIRKNE